MNKGAWIGGGSLIDDGKIVANEVERAVIMRLIGRQSGFDPFRRRWSRNSRPSFTRASPS